MPKTAMRTDAADAEDSERAAFSLVMELDARVEAKAWPRRSAATAASSKRRSQQLPHLHHRLRPRAAPATAWRAAEVLHEHRVQLDRLVAASGLNLARLARELKALLARPAHDGWDSARKKAASTAAAWRS